MSSAPLVTPPSQPQRAPGFVVDRQFFWLTAVLMVLAVLFCVIPEGFDFAYDPSNATLSNEGTIAHKLEWGPLYLLALYLIFRRARLATAMGPYLNLGLLLLYAWLLLTALWSPDPASTVRRSTQAFGMFLIAWGFTLASWTPQRLQHVLRWALLLFCIASAVVAIALPQIGQHQQDNLELVGGWKGLTPHKNTLGAVGSLTFVLWVHAWAAREIRPSRALAAVAIALLVVLKSRSSSSLLCAMLGAFLIVMILRQPLNLRGRLGTVLLGLFLFVVVPVFLLLQLSGATFPGFLGPLAGFFGKNTTLSGRSVLWGFLLREIPNHLWFGLGYGAFWEGEDSPSGPIVQYVHWSPSQGHDLYLDLLNEGGVIAILLLTIVFIYHFVMLVRVAQVNLKVFALHFGLFVYMIVANITETELIRPGTTMSIVFALSSLTLSRVLLEARWAAAMARRQQQTMPPPTDPRPWNSSGQWKPT